MFEKIIKEGLTHKFVDTIGRGVIVCVSPVPHTIHYQIKLESFLQGKGQADIRTRDLLHMAEKMYPKYVLASLVRGVELKISFS